MPWVNSPDNTWDWRDQEETPALCQASSGTVFKDIPDDTELTLDEWNAKVDAVLEDVRAYLAGETPPKAEGLCDAWLS